MKPCRCPVDPSLLSSGGGPSVGWCDDPSMAIAFCSDVGGIEVHLCICCLGALHGNQTGSIWNPQESIGNPQGPMGDPREFVGICIRFCMVIVFMRFPNKIAVFQ